MTRKVKNHLFMNKNPVQILIYTDYITLGQFLKLADIIQSGGEAKIFLASNEVVIDGEVDCRRGRKLRGGEKLVILNKTYEIIKK